MSKSFLAAFTSRVFDSLGKHFPDNVDVGRFGRNSAPSGFKIRYFGTILLYFGRFRLACDLFSDNESKDWFILLMAYRLLGGRRVRLPTNTDSYWANFEKAKSLPSEESNYSYVNSNLSEIRKYRISRDGKTLLLDASHRNVAFTFFVRQYYFERGGVSIKPEVGDAVLDLGSCVGDTAIGFAESVGQGGKVYAFDFLPEHISAIQTNIKQNDLGGIIEIVPFGVTDESNDVLPLERCTPDDSGKFQINPSGRIGSENAIPLVTLDDFVDRYKIKQVDFIKMDIEGAEISALSGARTLIAEFRPKLAISIYHKPKDLFEIPLLIKRLFPRYQFYLDHYTIHAEETVLYARWD